MATEKHATTHTAPHDPATSAAAPASAPMHAKAEAKSGPKELTPGEQRQADDLIAQLEKEAKNVAHDYIAARIPAEFQEYFASKHPA